MDLKEAIRLRECGDFIGANNMLLKLVELHPTDAQVQYQCAWSFDVLGLEKEAVFYYEKAIEMGLPDDDLKEALLGLGSTYRAICDYKNSARIFEKAIGLFDDAALKVFYAMTLHNLKEHNKAMEILLTLIVDKTHDESIQNYKKAIHYYSHQLDQKF